jgi:hypothetical protein
MSPPRLKLRLRRLATLLLVVLIAGCLGNDFSSAPLGVEKWDSGWLLAIEPEEQFSVGLLGSSAHPGEHWSVAEFDDAVLRMTGEEHEEPRPPSGDPEATEGDEHDPGSLVTRSGFVFEGVALGETPLRFELVVDGRLIDIAEYAVEVVEDACEADTAAVANRCGGDGFSYQPQMLHERNFGDETSLEKGASIELVLHGNELHPDATWAITGYDERVVTVTEPFALGEERNPGDYSEVSVEAPHSFIPVWGCTITGLAQGRTTLNLELTIDGQLLDEYETTFVVIAE